MPRLVTFPASEQQLADLYYRLDHYRAPVPWHNADWSAGVNYDELDQLRHRWRHQYNWRAHETEILNLPHKQAATTSGPVHYLHFHADSAQGAVLLTHGWPSSFLELVGLANRLSAPEDYGRNGPAFDVVVPSLPGFPFTPGSQEVPAPTPTHERWHELMLGLGYRHYFAHGGDLGAGVTTRLARAHPEAVLAIHLLAVAAPSDRSHLTRDEANFVDDQRRWEADEGGYEHLQRTKPTTLAPALSDSPVGLLSWLLEKYRSWSDRDSGPGLVPDFILTQASLYWFTNTIGPSFRPYFDYRVSPPTPSFVTVPTAVAVFPHDIDRPPRSWAARGYNVQRFTQMSAGGHFAAIEQPDLLADDLRSFFSDYVQ